MLSAGLRADPPTLPGLRLRRPFLSLAHVLGSIYVRRPFGFTTGRYCGPGAFPKGSPSRTGLSAPHGRAVAPPEDSSEGEMSRASLSVKLFLTQKNQWVIRRKKRLTSPARGRTSPRLPRKI